MRRALAVLLMTVSTVSYCAAVVAIQAAMTCERLTAVELHAPAAGSDWLWTDEGCAVVFGGDGGLR